jgi:hypothetical protein
VALLSLSLLPVPDTLGFHLLPIDSHLLPIPQKFHGVIAVGGLGQVTCSLKFLIPKMGT